MSTQGTNEAAERLLEELAAIEHQQWATWAETLLAMEPDISRARRDRWRRLLSTAYADLTEAEKHEDRVWAEKVLDRLAAERRATVERIRDWADKHERIGILSYPAAQRLRAILDEEAAR